MAKKKPAAHGKTRSTGKRVHHGDAEMDVLQDRFNGMELDFSQLAAVLGHQ